MRGAIYILDEPAHELGDLPEALSAESPADWEVVLVSSFEELIATVKESPHLAVAVVPECIAAETTLKQVAELRRLSPELPVVVTARQGSVEGAADAIRAGASDYLVRGERLRERVATLWTKLARTVEVLARNRQLDEQNAQLRATIQERFEIVGSSPAVRELIDRIRRVAKVPRPVLIVGERGTGKELVARAIHFSSDRAAQPIVTANCAAFSDSLLESELFGHERGAFTGADSARPGKFEQADGGTLFLDEIGHMSLAFQQKILRVVEYGTFARVGGMNERRVSVRIIAATNCDLRAQIQDGEFLPDLYDRLAFETIEAPPLRARRGDIPLLAQYFLQRFARETPAFRGARLTKEALAALAEYSFPGNIRELKNIIERAAYRRTEGQITPADLGLTFATPELPASTKGGMFHEQLDQLAHALIHRAIEQAQGNQAEAARRLGLTYHQFRYYWRKFAEEGSGYRAQGSGKKKRRRNSDNE